MCFALIDVRFPDHSSTLFLQVTEELNIAKGSVIDLQQKIAILERTQALQTNDKTHEKFLKQAQEKHAVEMKNMQTQIDVLTDKLNAKVLLNSLCKSSIVFDLYIFSIMFIIAA